MSSFTKQFCTFAALFTVVSGICFTSSANAQSVYSFSVTNTIGNVSGTFTGEIYGLLDNATSSASSVVIETIPDGMFNLEAVPIDAISWDQQYQNSFTVSGGQIVGGAFWAQKRIGAVAPPANII